MLLKITLYVDIKLNLTIWCLLCPGKKSTSDKSGCVPPLQVRMHCNTGKTVTLTA